MFHQLLQEVTNEKAHYYPHAFNRTCRPAFAEGNRVFVTAGDGIAGFTDSPVQAGSMIRLVVGYNFHE